MSQARWFHRRGELADGGWETVVDATVDGWEHTGLRVVRLQGVTVDLEPGSEKLVVPLAGSCTVRVEEAGEMVEHVLAGRSSVFDGPTDVLYVSTAARIELTGTGRVAIATSPTDRALPTTYMPASAVPLELRGSGPSSRQVHNFGTPDALDADRFIVCEVLTPSANWSSYPPHKHDEHVPGHESRLEEIYYFEAEPVRGSTGVDPAAAFGVFSTYSSPAGEIEIDARVHTGDVALVPYGYHGPAVAAPGYDLYYLNVMAGPDPERAWRITDDPAHAWVRGSWEGEQLDARLPFNTEEGSR